MKSKFLNFPLVFCFLLLSLSPVFAQSENSGVSYQIQSGETLGSIAELFGVQVESLIEVNQTIDPNSIFPGQLIVIPGLEGLTGIIKPVVLGLNESFDNIVNIYEKNSQEIIKLNKITSKDELYAGSKLLVLLSGNPPIRSNLVVEDDISLLESAIYLNISPEVIIVQNDFPLIPRDNINLPPGIDISALLDKGNEILISVSPLPIVQGTTITIRVSSKSLLNIKGNLAGHELFFFPDNSTDYFALQGINALAKTGVTQLSISTEDSSGEILTFESNILLQPGDFVSDPALMVDPATIDPLVTKPESDFVNSLVAQISPEKFWSGKFQSPAYYQEYTSAFGSRRTYNDNPGISFHGGVDFGGGETLPIIAPADGKIVFAGYLPVRGNATFIDHGLGVFSAYFHQSKLIIKEGDFVSKGQLIGEVGNTGRVSNASDYPGAGAHLHWEIWVNGNQVNPLDWLSNEYP